jgi:hypothetical protein
MASERGPMVLGKQFEMVWMGLGGEDQHRCSARLQGDLGLVSWDFAIYSRSTEDIASGSVLDCFESSRLNSPFDLRWVQHPSQLFKHATSA